MRVDEARRVARAQHDVVYRQHIVLTSCLFSSLSQLVSTKRNELTFDLFILQVIIIAEHHIDHVYVEQVIFGRDESHAALAARSRIRRIRRRLNEAVLTLVVYYWRVEAEHLQRGRFFRYTNNTNDELDF